MLATLIVLLIGAAGAVSLFVIADSIRRHAGDVAALHRAVREGVAEQTVRFTITRTGAASGTILRPDFAVRRQVRTEQDHLLRAAA